MQSTSTQNKVILSRSRHEDKETQRTIFGNRPPQAVLVISENSGHNEIEQSMKDFIQSTSTLNDGIYSRPRPQSEVHSDIVNTRTKFGVPPAQSSHSY